MIPYLFKGKDRNFTGILRRAILLVLLTAGIAGIRFTPLSGFITSDSLVVFITNIRNIWWSPLFLIALYMTMALFALPTAPLLMGGAIFGAFYGSLYNLIGLLSGAAISFYTAKLLGRDLVVRVTGERMRRAENFLARHGFWPLVQTRFMPIPFAVVNFGSGLAGVESPRFLSATVLGLVPSTLVHTYFISELISADNAARTVLLAKYAMVFIIFNIVISLGWIRKWRIEGK